jgi:hypothetical protein
LLTTLGRFDKSCGTFEKEFKQIQLPLLSMTLINRFEGSCGTFGEGKKPIVINNTSLVCPKNKI